MLNVSGVKESFALFPSGFSGQAIMHEGNHTQWEMNISLETLPYSLFTTLTHHLHNFSH